MIRFFFTDLHLLFEFIVLAIRMFSFVFCYIVFAIIIISYHLPYNPFMNTCWIIIIDIILDKH